MISQLHKTCNRSFQETAIEAHQHIGTNPNVVQRHSGGSAEGERPANAGTRRLLGLKHLKSCVLRVVVDDNQAEASLYLLSCERTCASDSLSRCLHFHENSRNGKILNVIPAVTMDYSRLVL